MEGMQAFGRRHFADLDRDSTEFVCLECVGSPGAVRGGGGGDAEDALVRQTAPASGWPARASDAGVPLRRGLRTVAATDGLISLRAGYPTCTLGAVDDTKFPPDYHWPTDTPENLILVEHRGCRRGVRGVTLRGRERPPDGGPA